MLHTEERAIRDSCPRFFLSRRLFLETEISSANEPRIRNNSRGARWKISAASAFISREEFIILKFLRKYVLTLQVFSYISQKEKYANPGLYQSDINIKVFITHKKIQHGLLSRDIFQKYVQKLV